MSNQQGLGKKSALPHGKGKKGGLAAAETGEIVRDRLTVKDHTGMPPFWQFRNGASGKVLALMTICQRVIAQIVYPRNPPA